MKRNTNKRWRFLLGVLVLTIALVACSGTSQSHNDDSHSQANRNDAVVNVTTQEMSISLDRSQLKAGTVTFLVQNNGFMTHDFAIRGNGIDEKTPMLNSGQSATLVVKLEPGTYTYECTMPGHSQAGMTGTLTATE
jgi:uncharacterized cupredoxin-like copper-binding protein